jgi:hypothetical protein
MNRAAAAFIVVFTIVATACGVPQGSNVGATPSATAAPTASALAPAPSPSSSPASTTGTFDLMAPASGPPPDAPQITCSGAIGSSDPVAIVQLHNGTVVLRDYANTAQPRSVCIFAGTPGSLGGVQLIDAHHVVVPRNGGDFLYAVVDLPEVRYHWFQLPNPPNQLPTFLAVSPSFDQVAWWSTDQPGNTDKVHLTTKAGDQVVASLTDPHFGRCGAADDSRLAAYTNSGNHLFVLDNQAPSQTSLLVMEGNQNRLLVTPPASQWAAGAQPAMAVWSPNSETLYYRQQGDVWRWNPASGSKRFLPGVKWYYPTISADGRYLAYAVPLPDGTHNVYLIDVAHSGSPVMIGKGPRNVPVFLNATQLWYKSEAQGICGPGGSQPLIYDLADGSEAPSVIDQPIAVWPAASSNF